MGNMIQIVRANSSNPLFCSLTALLDEELNSRYGELQKSYDKHNIIEHNNTVVIALDYEQPVGCGCFKPYSENMVEIKRMFVHKEYRGKGISKLVLKALENWAVEHGFVSAVLETGIGQHEAIGLYTSYGYNKIENYGQYAGNMNSVCMMKKLV
jgi:putative acetyltransferase